jgi:transcriptional regulator with XRE-family HTH domain
MTAASCYERKQVARAFGATLRAARLQRGVSQDQLGILCDFDRTYPSLLERGLRHPTLRMLLRLADALGTAPERLVTDTVARLREEAAVREPHRR